MADFTQAEADALLQQMNVRNDAAVMGENTSAGISLDGSGTWVDVGNYSLAVAGGNITVNGANGTITLGTLEDEPAAFQINMHVGVIETGSTKDWEYVLGWDVNGSTELIGSEYIATNKSSTADVGVIITRQFTSGDVVKLRITSLLKAVTVDITNSSLEVLRQF